MFSVLLCCFSQKVLKGKEIRCPEYLYRVSITLSPLRNQWAYCWFSWSPAEVMLVWTYQELLTFWLVRASFNKPPMKSSSDQKIISHFFISNLPLTLSFSGQILQMTNWWNFLIFSKKTGFDFSCKLSPMETICMKCQILFSGKTKKNISICPLL